eukprot:CAMPEP_0178463358 /NCGR_PEP_ID=MMETSP0689_2-20121128/50293_1 /TAXON_ID=160604 /ORGANISM="Amphidinium massartii, Strain CS-259" /LENGTH=667 /DNA_ID=CAMNT_0020090241 /DNA_START=44 /DNA_END=2048 /DNA_ORIENTATION=-
MPPQTRSSAPKKEDTASSKVQAAASSSTATAKPASPRPQAAAREARPSTARGGRERGAAASSSPTRPTSGRAQQANTSSAASAAAPARAGGERRKSETTQQGRAAAAPRRSGGDMESARGGRRVSGGSAVSPSRGTACMTASSSSNVPSTKPRTSLGRGGAEESLVVDGGSIELPPQDGGEETDASTGAPSSHMRLSGLLEEVRHEVARVLGQGQADVTLSSCTSDEERRGSDLRIEVGELERRKHNLQSSISTLEDQLKMLMKQKDELDGKFGLAPLPAASVFVPRENSPPKGLPSVTPGPGSQNLSLSSSPMQPPSTIANAPWVMPAPGLSTPQQAARFQKHHLGKGQHPQWQGFSQAGLPPPRGAQAPQRQRQCRHRRAACVPQGRSPPLRATCGPSMGASLANDIAALHAAKIAAALADPMLRAGPGPASVSSSFVVEGAGQPAQASWSPGCSPRTTYPRRSTPNRFSTSGPPSNAGSLIGTTTPHSHYHVVRPMPNPRVAASTPPKARSDIEVLHRPLQPYLSQQPPLQYQLPGHMPTRLISVSAEGSSSLNLPQSARRQQAAIPSREASLVRQREEVMSLDTRQPAKATADMTLSGGVVVKDASESSEVAVLTAPAAMNIHKSPVNGARSVSIAGVSQPSDSAAVVEGAVAKLYEAMGGDR